MKVGRNATSNRFGIDHEYTSDRAREGLAGRLELLPRNGSAFEPARQALVDPSLDHLQAISTWLAWVALGSALGGAARFFLSGFVGRRIGETFPWGTMAVNVTGAFAIGIIAAVASRYAAFNEPESWQFAVVGVLGSFTTVSSFSLQTLALVREGQFRRAGANILLSLALCLSTVALGFAAGILVADMSAT